MVAEGVESQEECSSQIIRRAKYAPDQTGKTDGKFGFV